MSIAGIIHRSLICYSLKSVAHAVKVMCVISLSRHWIVSIHEHKDHISFFFKFETCWDIGTSECYLLNALLLHISHLKDRLYTAPWSPFYGVNICGGLDVVCTQKSHFWRDKNGYTGSKVWMCMDNWNLTSGLTFYIVDRYSRFLSKKSLIPTR